MSSILNDIKNSDRSLAFLIDPEKTTIKQLTDFIIRINHLQSITQQELQVNQFYIFIGGSTMDGVSIDLWTQELKKNTKIPVVIFPGSYHQLTEQADGLLFLNLLSGNNPDYLVGQQRKAATLLKASQLQIIPTAYLLIDGGHESAVQRVSGTLPLSQDHIEDIVDTAYAGQLMGNHLVYLEAGSGAVNAVSTSIITAVKKQLDIPLIVGGGLRSLQQLQQSYLAGADMLVVGTAIEEDLNWIK